MIGELVFKGIGGLGRHMSNATDEHDFEVSTVKATGNPLGTRCFTMFRAVLHFQVCTNLANKYYTAKAYSIRHQMKQYAVNAWAWHDGWQIRRKVPLLTQLEWLGRRDWVPLLPVRSRVSPSRGIVV